LNVNPPSVVVLETVRFVVEDVSKEAVPVGTEPALQLAPVLKSPEPGLPSQVASCAAAGETAASDKAIDASNHRTAVPDGCLAFRNAIPHPPAAR